MVTGFYTRSLNKAARLKAAFLSLKRSGLRFRLRLLERRDWLDKWNAYFHVKPFGTRFVVVPLWEKSKFKPGKRLPVYLDPLGAFGTGCHETTRLMEWFMEKLRHRFTDFFDIGTGTGILSIAACLLGARHVLAIDTHGPSVQAARFNLRQNQCRARVLKADIAVFKPGASFDLVAANLLSGLLVEQKRKIIFSVRKRKHLLVSGIGLEHLSAFRWDFASRHLKCLKVLKGRKWAALLYRRVV